MITLFRPDTTYKLSEIKDAMSAYIRELPEKVSPIGAPLKIFRYELPIEPINILYWLHNQKADTKMYWSSREGTFETGGIGVADCLKGEGPLVHKDLFSYMEERLSADNPHLRYYGGMSFDPSCQDNEWKKFGAYQFIVPRFEIVVSQNQTVFAFNISVADINKENIENILTELNQIDFSTDTTYRKPPQVIKRSDYPDREQWKAIFADISDGLLNHDYDKIVLARRSIFDFDVSIRPAALMKHLKDTTPNCFHFCFQPSGETAFLGASPERLYKREGQNLQSEAIAGTRPRGRDEAQDRQLEIQLLNSIKDIREHGFVADTIREQFELFCRQIRADETFALRKLKGSQHLQTSFEGELDTDVHDYAILEALHPTPAVGGIPTKIAMKAIREKEPFGRGWYAGPFGYVGHEQSEFAVAIRSGMINGSQLSLYAGAGIVSGSTSDGEWDEIENKISNFIRVFEKTSNNQSYE